ncbi:MAG: hypothetical protein KC478_04545 [Bacteriovoracaceae bacterium]|nr:hypothetical protein [Bacteriovoracaceae bacterium]
MNNVYITEQDVQLPGKLFIPKNPSGFIIVPFTDSNGREISDNIELAKHFEAEDMAVLLLDLLTDTEAKKKENRFNVKLLSIRLEIALDWSKRHKLLRDLPLALHSSNTSGAVAMEAGAHTTVDLAAIVSCAGRIDMVEKYLPFVDAPCLLIVGSNDELALKANRNMIKNISKARLQVIEGAGHLFDDEESRSRMLHESTRWFRRYFNRMVYEQRKEEYRSENIHLPFYDRYEASHFLAWRLQKYKDDNPLVLAIPRGAVAMADIISTELDYDMDIILVKKLSAPNHPELAIGSINEFGDVYLSSNAKAYADEDYISNEAQQKQEQLSNYRHQFGSFSKPKDVSGRTVIILDDGIATGSTMLSAVITVKEKGATKVIVASPVVSASAQKMLQLAADETVFLDVPDNFYAVAQFYENFPQVDDEEVERILR